MGTTMEPVTFFALSIRNCNKGLLVKMDQSPCKTDPNACCEGSKCADYAAGHLSSVNTYLYGHFEWYSTRPGHGDGNTTFLTF